MHRRQLAAYAALALIWGVSFLLVLKVSTAFGWVGATAFRSFTASAILLVLARLSGRALRFGSWRPLAAVGATTVVGQLLCLSYATPRIGTAMEAILVAGIPLFSMVIGQAWGVERIARAGRAGLVAGVVGIVLLVGFPSQPVTPGYLVDCAIGLLGSFSAALGSNIARRHLGAVGSWEQTIGAFFFGGLIPLPLLLVAPVPGAPRLEDLGYLVLLAALCSSLAYVLYFRLIAEVGATIAISVEFLVTLVAVLIGAVLLGEQLTPVQLAGGVVIVGGCSLVLGLLPPRHREAIAVAA